MLNGSIDWRNLRREGELHAYMIPPTRLDDMYGELLGIDWSTLSITAAYDTDTRVSGTLSFTGDGWIEGSFLRIVYEIPEYNYTHTLGTFVATENPSVRENGIWKTTLTLHSLLFTMSLDIAARPRGIAARALYSNAMIAEFEDAKRPYKFLNPKENVAASPLVMESGRSRLERMFLYCTNTGNRLDVDGDGYITVSPYQRPGDKSASFSIELGDAMGVAYDGATMKTNYLSMPSEAAVVFNYTEPSADGGTQNERTIIGTATVSTTSHAHSGARGYNITSYHNISDLNPPTAAHAQAMAQEYLAKDEIEQIEWNIRTKYLPLWEGDVIELIVPGPPESRYAGYRKCLVKSITFSGRWLDTQLTLREVSERDE